MRKALMSLFALTVATSPGLVSQTVIPGGDVSGLWPQAQSPYHVTGDITIPDDSTLTIEPGVRVEFQGHYALYVRGSLLAVGTEADSIVFTVADTTGFSDPDTTLGGWYGIRMFEPDSSNDSTIISYCRLSYGKAIGPNWPFNHGGAISIVGFDRVRISNCLIADNLAGGPESPTGGGIGFSSADILITDNTIVNNIAWFGGGANGQTAGARLERNIFLNNRAQGGAGLGLAWSDITLHANRFEENQANSGGGAIQMGESICRLTENTFVGNTAPDGGGAIGVWHESEAHFAGDIIRENQSANGPGGGILGHDAIVTMKGVVLAGNTARSDAGLHAFYVDLAADSCLFEENLATDVCGAIGYHCDTLGPRQRYEVRVSDTRFMRNSAVNSGGAVRLSQTMAESSLAEIHFDRCQFEENTSNTAASLSFNGAFAGIVVSNSTFRRNTAALRTAGLSFAGGARGVVYNCLLEGNRAGADATSAGAALSIGNRSDINVMHCTIANNVAGSGSALSVRAGSRAAVANSILWGNSGTAVVVVTTAVDGAHLVFNYCDLQYGKDSVSVSDTLSTLTWGAGNIDADPLFADSAAGDFHLSSSSPCIGAATDSIELEGVWFTAPAADIEGLPRPGPKGTAPDMGAFEEQVTLPTGVSEQPWRETPNAFALRQNYPNPFNPVTRIRFTIADRRLTIVSVYDLLGREVATLVNDIKEPGTYEAQFDASHLASGIYLYRLQTGGFVRSLKMVLMR